MQLIIILIGLPALITAIDLIVFLTNGKRVVNIYILRIVEIAAFFILPYLYSSPNTVNDCCGDTTPFSPAHQPTILVYIILCSTAYFYCSYRTKIAAPVIEIIVNSLILVGIVFNIFIALQTSQLFFALCGNMPIIILAILVLVKNQKLFINYSEELVYNSKNKLHSIAWKILTLRSILKYPLILILCLPLLVVVTALLLLAGQKPDSVIRAFTDTYKHGFSQWNYKCDNVECGGHYLCSVAANGHTKVVKPQRLGIRNGNYIICNRQLLISNAFEDLLQENYPFLHKAIRYQYNKVGNTIHRYYKIFNNKYVADFIYILMKPLEWFFLLILYSFDKKPENRIAKQYLSNTDRLKIDDKY